jgi:hypothetical protein
MTIFVCLFMLLSFTISLSPENPDIGCTFDVSGDVGAVGAVASVVGGDVSGSASTATEKHALPGAAKNGAKRKKVAESEEDVVTRLLDEAIQEDMVHLGLQYSVTPEELNMLPSWIERSSDGKEVTCLSCNKVCNTKNKG